LCVFLCFLKDIIADVDLKSRRKGRNVGGGGDDGSDGGMRAGQRLAERILTGMWFAETQLFGLVLDWVELNSQIARRKSLMLDAVFAGVSGHQ